MLVTLYLCLALDFRGIMGIRCRHIESEVEQPTPASKETLRRRYITQKGCHLVVIHLEQLLSRWICSYLYGPSVILMDTSNLSNLSLPSGKLMVMFESRFSSDISANKDGR